MDDSCVFAVRAKYADDLEELVQCPVCFERPVGTVPMCIQGHHLCKRCRDQISNCPICKSPFSTARNYVVEELSAKLKDILSSLLAPNLHDPFLIPPTPKGKKPTIITKSIETQTDKSTANSHNDSLMIVDEFLLKSCLIGFCHMQLPAECMHDHVRDFHSDKLIKVNKLRSRAIDHESSCLIRSLYYDLDKMYDYAFNVTGLGLFFVNLHIDGKGNLFVDVKVAKARNNSKMFYKWVLSIPCRTTVIERTGEVGECSVAYKKLSRAQKYERKIFDYYYEKDLDTLRKSRLSATFTFKLWVDVNEYK